MSADRPAAAGRVLVVDDAPDNRDVIRRLLEREGYTVCTAADGERALEAVKTDVPDIVLLDVMLPGMSGFEVCRRLKADHATRLIPVVLVTTLRAREERIAGIEAGADDFLSKPIDFDELFARVRSLVRLRRYIDDLESAEAVVLSLGLTIEARDPYTHGHCERLARYAAALGERLGLPNEDLAALRRGGFLHDIGKIAVPDAVLVKPGPLDADERRTMELHPVVGERLCGDLRSLQRVRPVVRQHHERCDGSGYPDGRAKDEIDLLAQIIGVVDVFDAMASDRPYRRGLPQNVALAQLRAEVRGGWRRQDLVEPFIDLIQTTNPLAFSVGEASPR